MAAVCGITSLKYFTYRGAVEEWSNTYHFSGVVPANPTDWRALYDALWNQEKTFLPPTVKGYGAYGYDSDADDAHAVWSLDLRVPPGSVNSGALSVASNPHFPGDVAMWVRWKTSRLTSKGKPIYLRKYFHGVIADNVTDPDLILSTQNAALVAFGGKMRDGTFLDARTIRSSHSAETILGSAASSYATTRTLKRRGPRP